MADHNPYDKTEETVLREYYPTEGAKGCIKRLAELGYRRNGDSVRVKARSLGVKRDRSVRYPSDGGWSDSELAILRKTYPRGGCPAVRRALEQAGYSRTDGAIRVRATMTGVQGPYSRRKAAGKGDVKLINICLDTNFDQDIIRHIEGKRNRSSYIRGLIRADLQKAGGTE